MHDFLQRLRERKLVQWALAYLAGAWVLLQVVGLIGQQFDWPPTLMRGITVAAGVGFFVALVLAWYHGERGAQRATGTELMLIALLLAIGGGLLWRFAPRASETSTAAVPQARTAAPAATTSSDKSIAVLPFANLSDDKANAYFADGMQDEILTKLAKIGALRVVSRTTTKRFAGSSDDMATIAQKLGVAHLLEGSVQKSGNAVHINVQLIRAATDEHLWAESYDRTLENVFGVQGEVAQAVADALKATLTGAEQAAVRNKGTENAKAFEAYLQGRAADQSGYSFTSEALAVDHYLVAVREDPGFAQAWSAAAVAMSDLYFNGYDAARSTAAAVKDAADAAVRAQPQLAESAVAQGAYYYRVARDYPKAHEYFQEALGKQPGDVDILAQLFFVERRIGLYEAALAHYREILVRDPRNISLRVQGATEVLFWLRDFDETRRQLEQALAFVPDDTTALACLALLEQALGRLDAADKWLVRVPKESRDFYEAKAWLQQLSFRHDYAGLAAYARISAARADAELSVIDWMALIRLGYAQRDMGDQVQSQATFRRLEQALVAHPDATQHIVELGTMSPLVYAGLGEHDRALAAARHQVEAFRFDQLELATAKTTLAQVLAMAGKRDEAIALAAESLELFGGTTPALLALDPLWDSIRDDPRFVELTKRPVAPYKAHAK